MSELNDFYLKCKGAQITRPEREFIKRVAADMDAAFDYPLFVNIGVAWGATMHCMRAGSPEARIIGIDVDYETRRVQEPELLEAELWRGDSGILHSRIGQVVHLLFIDGCHYYGTVKADIQGWTPKVVVGGVVIFHDYAPTEQNLKRWTGLDSVRYAVDEWRSDDWQRSYDVPDSLAYFVRVS